jgi:hypothetical protein
VGGLPVAAGGLLPFAVVVVDAFLAAGGPTVDAILVAVKVPIVQFF